MARNKKMVMRQCAKRTYFMRLCYGLICFLIPVKKQQLVFISFPDAVDNSWHLYRYMVDHVQGHEFVWLCDQPSSVRERIEQESQRYGRNSVVVARRLSLKGMWLLITSRLVFTSHGVSRFVGRARGRTVVNLWHGMPIKAIGYLDPDNRSGVSYCDYTLSTSPLYTQVMAQAFNIPKSRVLEVGLPRNDALVIERTPLEREAIFTALGLETGADLVFWLPTFRHSGRNEGEGSFLNEWNDDLFQRLNAAAQTAKCYIFIKLHPLDCLNGDPPPVDYERVKLFTAVQWKDINIDLYDALAVSSALISDISSVVVDYIAVRRSIGITSRAFNNYDRELIKDVAALVRLTRQLSSVQDMCDFITRHHCDVAVNQSLVRYNAFNAGSLATASILTYFIGDC